MDSMPWKVGQGERLEMIVPSEREAFGAHDKQKITFHHRTWFTVTAHSSDYAIVVITDFASQPLPEYLRSIDSLRTSCRRAVAFFQKGKL